MIGVFVGIVAGAAMFWLLTKFTGYITKGKSVVKGILFGFASFILPMIVLLAMVFILRSDLISTAVATAATLIVCAIAKYVISTRNTRGREEKND